MTRIRLPWLGAGLLALCLQPGLAPAQSAPEAGTAQPTLVVEIGSHSAPARRIDVNAARGLVVTVSDDRTARVWDLNSGELRQVLRPLAQGLEIGRLYGAAIHPGEPLVAVAGTSGGRDTAHLIYLFDLDSGALRRTIDARAGDIRKLVWSPDGTVLLAGYNGPDSNGVRAFALDGRELLSDRLPGPVFGIAVGAGGRAAAVALDGTLRSYRVGAGAAAVAGSVSIAGRRPAGVSYSPDGARLAVAYATPRESPEIFDSTTLTSRGRLAGEHLFGGDWRVLAWSADGRSVFVGGTAYTQALRFPVLQLDAASGAVLARVDAAADSITDLVALPAGGVAYTSFDGSWGLIGSAPGGGAPQLLRRVGTQVRAVSGTRPLDLEIADDARSVRWAMNGAGGGFGFAFAGRRLELAPTRPLRAPQTRFGLFSAPSDWNQDSRPPVIGGKPMALAADERGRALAVLRGDKPSAVVGTNRALYRVSEQGEVLWRVVVDTEIRALNASADGRLITGALADGTVRWWRAADGVLLLTLLAQADGHWVLWTPSGYFDAGAGADRLVGWALPRGQQEAMSFYSLNRFRDRFLRPDVIDALFEHLDEGRAVAALNERAQAERVALQRQAAEQAEQARRAEAQAVEEARQAAAREAELRAAAAQGSREAAARAEAARQAQALALADAQRSAQAAQQAREQAAAAEAQRETARREAAARAEAEQAARDSAARAEEARRAETAGEAARLAALARRAAEREAQAREVARVAAEEATRAEQARELAARELAQRQAAEAEGARRAAQALADAQAAAAREAAQRDAAREAERLLARLQAARASAAREAEERAEAARAAQREAAARQAGEQARAALQALKANEFPPTLVAVSAQRVKASGAQVALPFALSASSEGGAVTIQLRINGRPVQASELVLPRSVDGRSNGLVKLPVELFEPGRTQVEVIAGNRYGLSEALAFIIEREAAAAAQAPAGPTADLHVLAVGVAEYARKEYNLGLPAKDARDFAATMQRQEGRLYRRVIVHTLTNQQATRAAVLRELDDLRSKVAPGDVAMIFMAGHGVNDEAGNYYFMPHDGRHDRVASTGVPQSAIVSGLSKIRGKTILFVDTCFAGNALGAMAKTRQTGSLINDLASSENGVVVFASSTGQEESEEKDEWGNGAFTKALLEGLGGKADFMRAGRVTYAALNLFVSEEVTRLTSGRQRPVFISPRGIPDFALARL